MVDIVFCSMKFAIFLLTIIRFCSTLLFIKNFGRIVLKSGGAFSVRKIVLIATICILLGLGFAVCSNAVFSSIQSIPENWVVRDSQSDRLVKISETAGVYDGTEKTGYQSDGHILITGTNHAVDVGVYEISATPEAGFTWMNTHTSESRVFSWEITKAQLEDNEMFVEFRESELRQAAGNAVFPVNFVQNMETQVSSVTVSKSALGISYQVVGESLFITVEAGTKAGVSEDIIVCLQGKNCESFLQTYHIEVLADDYKKAERIDSPILKYSVTRMAGMKIVSIQSVENAEYSFDGGQTWSDVSAVESNSGSFMTLGIRYKETRDMYASVPTMQVVQLEKLSQSVSFSDSEELKIYGDADFINLLNGVEDNAVVRYESSNPNVASVNPDTGIVSVGCAGTAMITAYIDATDTYAAAELSFSVIVKKKEVPIPSLPDNLQYTGYFLSSGIRDNLWFSVEEPKNIIHVNTSDTEYPVVFSLNDIENTVWENGTCFPVTQYLTVHKSPLTIAINPVMVNNVSDPIYSSYVVYGLSDKDRLENVSVVVADVSQLEQTHQSELLLDSYSIVCQCGEYDNYEVVSKSSVVTLRENSLQQVIKRGGAAMEQNYKIRIESKKHGALYASDDSAFEGDPIIFAAQPNDGYRLSDISIETEDGRSLDYFSIDNHEFQFIMPDSDVVVCATFAVETSFPFRDVPSNSWYRESVEYIYSKGVTTGINLTTYHPEGAVTRGAFITFLYRLSGEPVVSGESSFKDARENQSYQKAIIWAEQNHILYGYENHACKPNQSISREEAVLLLMRYAEFLGINTETSYDISHFRDERQISLYARTSMQWAVENNLIYGASESLLSPHSVMNRAQSAVLLYRFCVQFTE